MNAAVQTEHFVAIDYPQKGEAITSNHYSLRISASPDVQRVDVAIDRDQPLECRRAAGYFWYDWTNVLPGQHEIVAIATFADGSTEETKARRILIEPPQLTDKV